ncbi:hypothetical protein MACJ_002211 [Theileria orientalis]|uniref:Uncharacterized protein n=1 Tax=Theileria orientalis TaxID=68886 RepID=A0A976QSI2_THEOR|nr:hypothetical protein MACJ_002211 [Theileria orientalis]
MSLCGVSQLFSTDLNECPPECPFWAPSSVWKYIGVCSKSANCKLFNPTLHFADVNNHVCLPCNVFGCISCAYSNADDSTTPITDNFKKLPDFCIQCAKGYKRSNDGQMCYLVDSSIWPKLLRYLMAFVLLSIAVLIIRLLMDREKMKNNFNSLLSALKNQQKKMLRKSEPSGRTLYGLSIDVRKNNISGIGLMLYFRGLVFFSSVMALLFFSSLAHVHIPCSKMIRIFKEPFRVYYFVSSPDERGTFISNFFSENVNKLVDDIFNFKSVDEAINWNVVAYSKEVSSVMNVLYISIMAMTVVYLVSQKRVIKTYTSSSTKLKDLTLVLRNLPKSITNENEIADMIYESSGVKPASITICYDLKRHKKDIDKLLESVDEMNAQEDGYINFDRVEEFNKSFTDLKSSGECFVTFENSGDCRNVLHSFKNGGIGVEECDVEPENVMWENIGYEKNINGKILAISIVTIGCLTVYSVVFFVPYAIYSISSQMKHLLEVLVVSLFLDCGNTIVSVVLRSLITRAGIINSDVVEGYLMFCSYFIKLLNMLLNIVLSHIINYGGMHKLLSLLGKQSNLDTPTFRVGEEVSFSVSFSIYMVNVLIIIPNGFFVIEHYVFPLVNSFLVLTLDFDVRKASRLMEYSKFDISAGYSNNLANITCCLFLLFLIKDRKQGCIVFLSMCISYFLNYLKDQFIVLRRSSRKFYSTWRLCYVTFVIWAFPTLVLAVCPHYWSWRAGEGGVNMIVLSGLVHMFIYGLILYALFGRQPLHSNLRFSDLVEDKSTSPEQDLEYKLHNPLYKLKLLSRQYNVL